MLRAESDLSSLVRATRRAWRWLGPASLALLAGLCPACGGDSAGASDAAQNSDGRIPMPLDASADADYSDATPNSIVLGPGLALNQVAFATSGHAWANWAPLVNPQFVTAINQGALLVVLELRDLDDPSGQDDANGLDLAIYAANDTDANPSNNYNGSASLRISASSLDPLNNPRALLPGATLTGGTLSGAVAGPIDIYLPGIGELRLYDATFSAKLLAASDGESVSAIQDGILRGTLLARDLEAVANPVSSTCLANSMLDLAALPCLSFDGAQPDVDRDDDGLERFEENRADLDGQIDLCTDGNGQTFVSTPTIQCVLDPAFQDGYTFELRVAGVRALLEPPF